MSHSLFAPLLLITLLAVLVPVAVSRLRGLRLPVVVAHGDPQLLRDDVLMLIESPDALRVARQWLAHDTIADQLMPRRQLEGY